MSLRERFGIETRPQASNVVEDGEFLYLRSQLIDLGATAEPRFASVTFVLGDRVVATISDDPEFRPFDAVLQRCKRRPSNAESPKRYCDFAANGLRPLGQSHRYVADAWY